VEIIARAVFFPVEVEYFSQRKLFQ
jgi:hypothetical protein